MATATINYGTATAITCSSASLASSATFVAGRESTEIDNTTNKFVDALVEGFVTVGTTPTVDTEIRVYAWGSHTALSTTAKDTLDGLDSAETLVSAGVRDGFLKRIATMRVDATTSDRKYHFGPIGLAQVFDELPQYWGLFITHGTGVALNSTAGNHEFKYTGIKYDSA